MKEGTWRIYVYSNLFLLGKRNKEEALSNEGKEVCPISIKEEDMVDGHEKED